MMVGYPTKPACFPTKHIKMVNLAQILRITNLF